MIERRIAKRFQVDWPIRVECAGGSEGSFIDIGALKNISSSGALLSLPHALAPGTQLDVYIKLPLKGKTWMKYPARVIRTESGEAAVTFAGARPDFAAPFVSM